MIELSPRDRDLLHRLDSTGLSILVESEGREVYRSGLAGVRPLLELVDRFPCGLPGATVADRVVGGCAARVFVRLAVVEVIAGTMSEAGRAILASSAVRFSHARLVPEIRNRDNSGTCPFESLSREHDAAESLIAAIRAKLAPPARGG